LNPFKKHICDCLEKATGLPFQEICDSLEMPPDESWGDYGWPCHNLSRSLKKNPNLIATELKSSISTEPSICSVSVKGPYLNFKLDKKEVIKYICHEIFSKGSDFAKDNIGQGKTVVIDYSSPNIAKPMGIGHLRSTVLGASLKNIFKHLGYRVVGINHLGDWGTQFGKLVVAYKRWADPQKMEKEPIEELYRLYVKIHKESEEDKSLEEESRCIFKKLEDGDPEIVTLWKKFVDLSWKDFQRIYDLLGIKFELVAGESFYNKMMSDTISLLERKNLAKLSQGALIIPLSDYEMEPLLLKKRDGSSLYGTRDLTAAIYRYNTYKFDKLLYVVGVAQSLHFKQLFKTLELMGYDWASRCHHVSFGWVTLAGEMMSTRKGNVVFLEDVLKQASAKALNIIEKNNPDLENKQQVASQVGIGAIVFTNLSVKRQTDVSFDWDRMLDFNGQTGPYLQYAHARLSSVMRKYGEDLDVKADYELLKLPEEYRLAKKLMEFPDKIVIAAKTYEPYIISSYLLDTVSLFSTYFQRYKSPRDKILSDDPRLKKARVNLSHCLKTVLKSGLNILGLEAPEKM